MQAAHRIATAGRALTRQESGTFAAFSGRALPPGTVLDNINQQIRRLRTVIGERFSESLAPLSSHSSAAFDWQTRRTKLTVKTSTKAHRFSHHIKVDRELELRAFWGERRRVTNPAHLYRLVNFSRIYARFRDLDYLPHTMRDWDVAIERLFDHSRGMEPANGIVRKHPYLLNVKILPLQFAKNAVKGKLPLYDWRLVLRDLRLLVGEDLEAPTAEPGRQPGAGQDAQAPFRHAKRVRASLA